jgi:chromosome partitioning protein
MIIAMSNQKGGVAKTATTVNLGVGLARQGKKVLLVDCDPQGSLSISLGITQPDESENTLADAYQAAIAEQEPDYSALIRRHSEGADFLPANVELASIEVALVNAMSRETVLRGILEPLRSKYDYILLDTTPSLGLLTLNSLAAADKVIIPVQAQYLSLKGLEQLLATTARIKRRINPGLEIGGILLTMVDRTSFGAQIIDALEENYGGSIRIFDARVPRGTKAAESSATGTSIYSYDPRGKIAEAYTKLTEEVSGWVCGNGFSFGNAGSGQRAAAKSEADIS